MNFLYAVGGFSIATIAFMWPDPESEAPTATPYTGPWLAKVSIPILFVAQLAFIPVSYKWNRSAFFVTNELLPAEEFRLAQVQDWENQMADEQLEQAHREIRLSQSIPIISIARGQGPSHPSTSIPKRSPTLSSSSAATQLVRWVSSFMADIPEGAVPLGHESNEDPSALFAARVRHNGNIHLGKAGAHLIGGASIAYQGNEVACSSYDVLVGAPSAFSWFEISQEVTFMADSVPPGWKPLGAGRTEDDVYLAASSLHDGFYLGSVRNGDAHASIPLRGKVQTAHAFRILLVKEDAT